MPEWLRKKRKPLSTSTSGNISAPSLTKCVEVYLCDNCDKDFDSPNALISHEKSCSNNKEVVCLGAGSTPQQAFLGSSFQLSSKKGNHPNARRLKEGQRPK